MLSFQDLPDELILQILSYSETKDLIICGQVSKRIRNISHDGSLWMTANLEKKIVKAELLEIILSKGCKILNLSNSTIVGGLTSNMRSELRVLDISQSATIEKWHTRRANCKENTDFLDELVFSCYSLQHLAMENLWLTPKMADSIRKNGKTLQVLNLNGSFANDASYLLEIIKSCQELKEVGLAYFEHVDINFSEMFSHEDLAFLAKQISPNVEKLDLSGIGIIDDHVEIILQRCKKIKALSLESSFITDISMMNIRRYLNLTLEELSLGNNFDISFTGFLKLKSMPRLKILNLYDRKEDEIQNLRLHLPHLMIKIIW